VSPYFIVIGGVFRKNSPKVFRVEHDQMIGALAPDRADQAFSISIARANGKMDIRRGSSVQSDGIALTTSLCSANDISAICSIPTKNITTKLGRTYRCTRTRQFHVLSRPSVARWRCQFWAGCITNISGRKFPTGTG
jgi:hypothetical protein